MASIASILLAPFRAVGRLFGSDEPPEQAPTPPAETEIAEFGVMFDQARGRDVPYRLYIPDTDGPAPVVFFSHGVGGTVDAAPYLGRALAEAGYWGVFLQHFGSDETAFAGAEGPEEVRDVLMALASDPQNMMDRFQDVSFAIGEVARLNGADGPFHERFDLEAVGLAGHSYGARTVMALTGQAMGVVGPAFKDPRVRAGLALSPSGGRGPFEDDPIPAENFAAIDVPLLHVTGTRDAPAFRGTDFDPYVRTLPFQSIPADDQYLLVLDGAEHDDLGGTVRGVEAPESRYTLIVAEVALLFFDAYLKRSETAWSNLRAKMPEFLDPVDYFEFR